MKTSGNTNGRSTARALCLMLALGKYFRRAVSLYNQYNLSKIILRPPGNKDMFGKVF